MLQAVELTRRGTDGAELLTAVSLSLDPGERLALVGPSGSGKSLLLRALALLDRCEGGYVEWRGAVPSGDAIPEYRRRVLYLQQAPMVSEASVGAQLALPWEFRSAGGSSFDRVAAAALLEATGREASFLDQRGGNLSGGEAQLLAMVRALLLESTVLLLDEPTSAMDPVTRDGVESLLDRWLAADPQRAWIWVSHDPEQLERMCRRRVEIGSGRLLS